MRGGNKNPAGGNAPPGAFRELQRGLTGERSLIGESYMDIPGMLRSYLDYYWPVSREQARYALRFAPHAVGTVIDIGSGPGPIAAAFLDSGAERAVLIDQSRKALDLAVRELPSRCGIPSARISSVVADISSPDASSIPFWGKADCVSFGHSLNELFSDCGDRIGRRAALLEYYARALAEGGFMLVIEPALLATSRDLLAVRNILVERGWRVIAPCPGRETLACPALSAGESHTCHEEIAWDMPAETASLASGLKLDKEVLKMTWFILEPPRENAADTVTADARGVAAAGAAGADTVTAADFARTADTVTAAARGSAANNVSAADFARADNTVSIAPGAAVSLSFSGLYRVVSDPMLNKAGRVRRLLCGEAGRFPLSAQEGSADGRRTGFDRLSRGDYIRVINPEIRENGWGIGSDTAIIRETIPGAR